MQHNSNTTLVKVKCKYPMLACRYAGYSNTTLVKVKFKEGAKWIIQKTIQIQHLLKLNIKDIAALTEGQTFKYNTC